MAAKNDNVRRQVRHARDKAAEIKDQAEDMVEEEVGEARDYVEALKNRAEAGWRQAKRQAQARAGQVNEYAHDNPWQMAAIGAGVGFLLAALLIRRRD